MYIREMQELVGSYFGKLLYRKYNVNEIFFNVREKVFLNNKVINVYLLIFCQYTKQILNEIRKNGKKSLFLFNVMIFRNQNSVICFFYF